MASEVSIFIPQICFWTEIDWLAMLYLTTRWRCVQCPGNLAAAHYEV